MDPLYFDDLAVGDTFTSGGRTVTEADVTMFAMLSSDWNPIHTNAEVAAQTPFGERIMHGMLGLALVTGLFQRTGMFDGTAVALLGVQNWKFTAPVRIGDTVHATMEIATLRLTSRGDRGVVDRKLTLLNQHGETTQTGHSSIMLRCRRRG